jgi:hypothetical protein
MHGDGLNLLLRVSDHNQDKEHVDVTYEMDRPLV